MEKAKILLSELLGNYMSNFAHIHKAASQLRRLSEKQKNQFLKHLAEEISSKKNEILSANEKDVSEAEKKGWDKAFLHRLTLDEKGVDAIVKRLSAMETLTSDLGKAIEERKLPNGVILKKIRVPLGTILIIYEARPEVTIDVASLCIKSGNCVVLKGGSEALRTNSALYNCIVSALKKSGIEKGAVTFIESTERKELYSLLKRSDVIDLVIARGGYKMVADVMNRSNIPVLAHAAGGARIYVDKSADLEKAINIVVNAKITKPAACNSVDTVVIHKDIASTFVPKLTAKLKEKGVTIIEKPKEKDFEKEFLDLVICFKIVADVDEALAFIQKYSKKHSEGIVAEDKNVIDTYTKTIDAAALFINCSPRLHDGFEFGLGAEMGIATGKLHARGPVGLIELTTYKWEAYGDGQVRA